MSDSTVVPADVLIAARETYELTKDVLQEDHETALCSALAAGIRKYEQRILERVAVQVETYAREMVAEADEDPEDDGVPEFALALGWAADKIRQEMDLDPSGEYEPEDEDVVEVTIVGEVTVGGFAITPGKGTMQGWVVQDDFTGLEFAFPFGEGLMPRVRVISRAKERIQELPDEGDQ